MLVARTLGSAAADFPVPRAVVTERPSLRAEGARTACRTMAPSVRWRPTFWRPHSAATAMFLPPSCGTTTPVFGRSPSTCSATRI